MNVTIPAILLLGAGILLIAGLWTPIAGVSVALTEVWKMLMLPGDKWLWLMLGTAAAALAMLGPGLWSVDARLFGGSASKLRPQKSLYSRKVPNTKFLSSKEVLFLPRVCDCPNWGCRKGTGGQWLRHQETRVKGREALMWKITTRGFTLQEILIMAAMNVATHR